MTKIQKDRITLMRGNGESYMKIAAALRISENTVKSFCRRNINKTVDSLPETDACEHCGSHLSHTPKAKKKRFCSDKCRMDWWKYHPEALRRKAIYDFVCANCGSNFESYGNAHRKYCSMACFGARVAK